MRAKFDGGLDLIVIHLYTNAIKTTWVKRLKNVDLESQWSSFIVKILEPFGGILLFDCQIKEKEIEWLAKKVNLFLKL